MNELMSKTREIFNEKRQNFTFKLKMYNRLNQPGMMLLGPDPRFKAVYKDQKMLFNEGRVAMASIVQANSFIFEKGSEDLPAVMIFSEDPYFEDRPEELRKVASDLFSIKGEQLEDKEVQVFSDILANEMETLFNYKLPKKLTGGRDVYYTTFVVIRKHMPNKRLDCNVFPALVLPEKTDGAIILPSKYWADGLYEQLTTL